MNIDMTTEFGQRVQRRLEEERIIWLTTVDTSGTPQPRPVWFVWDGETVLIFSKPDTVKHTLPPTHASLLTLMATGTGVTPVHMNVILRPK